MFCEICFLNVLSNARHVRLPRVVPHYLLFTLVCCGRSVCRSTRWSVGKWVVRSVVRSVVRMGNRCLSGG